MTATIGTVRLWVANTENLTCFYEEVIGLRVLGRTDDVVALGVDEGNTLLELHYAPDRKRYRGATGLYHFALLLPNRLDLAKVFRHLIEKDALQGASDHIVSEALYLSDPEGNGIEIYWDRPRDRWYKDGKMQLDTLALDAGDLMRELQGESNEWNGLPSGTIVGHIHLHVANVQQAAKYYTDTLGMDLLFDMGSAGFLSYDEYHHHVGINIWGVRGYAPDDALGLKDFDLHVSPERYVTITDGAGSASLEDPAHNVMHLLQ